MREPITQDDVDEVELSTSDYRQIAEQLIEWGEHPHPDDELSPRELLTSGGEHLELADDPVAAEAVYRRAVLADGYAELDPRSHLVAVLLGRGERDEALVLDRELRRSRPAEPATYDYMADVWVEYGDDRRALGWVTRGLLLHEQGPGFADTDLSLLCLTRWTIRERQGHEPDDYDFIGIGMLSRLDHAEEEHRSR